MKKDFLPIGSVVKIKKSKKDYMIIAVYVEDNATKKTYDYCACVFPFGQVSPESNVLFNTDSIEQVIFTGYKNELQEEYYDDINWQISKEAETNGE